MVHIYVQCTPPGLIYARAGEMRANNKVLVLQVGSRQYISDSGIFQRLRPAAKTRTLQLATCTTSRQQEDTWQHGVCM